MKMVIYYGSRSEDKMAIYTAARPTFENEYIHGIRVQSLHGYILGLKMNIYTAAVFNVTCYIHGLKMNIYTAAIFNVTYGYIHGLKMNIYTAAVFKVAWLYTLLPFLHMKMANIRLPCI